MPGTKCPTVRSAGTTSVRSALMPILMNSRASMGCFPSLSPCGRGWINRAKRAIETGEGSLSASKSLALVFADRTPHPADYVRHLLPQGEKEETSYFFAAAARSTNVLPPFILWASGASLIWITTASASTPRFLTSAWVMSRIMPAFCSSVRPAAMLTVISGIFGLLVVVSFRRGQACPGQISCIKQDVDARHKAGHDAGNE